MSEAAVGDGRAPDSAGSASWGPPSVVLGALSGALAVVAFTVVHEVFILDIWRTFGPMLFAGMVSGLSIVWSYDRAVADHSTARWFGYNAILTLLLLGLGAASFLVLQPEFSMAELMVADDALGQVIPPAVPLMIAAIVAGTLLLWVLYGRRRAALIPILLTQLLLVVLVGHNLAILGLVEMSSDLVFTVAEFIGLTVFLAAAFAAGVALMGLIRARVARPG